MDANIVGPTSYFHSRSLACKGNAFVVDNADDGRAVRPMMSHEAFETFRSMYCSILSIVVAASKLGTSSIIVANAAVLCLPASNSLVALYETHIM